MQSFKKFEFIKKSVEDGKIDGPVSNLITALIYAIANAFFSFLIRLLIDQLIKLAESYGVSIEIPNQP